MWWFIEFICFAKLKQKCLLDFIYNVYKFLENKTMSYCMKKQVIIIKHCFRAKNDKSLMKHQVLGQEWQKFDETSSFRVRNDKSFIVWSNFHKLTHFKESNVEKEIGLDLDSHRFSWGSLEVYNQCWRRENLREYKISHPWSRPPSPLLAELSLPLLQIWKQ